MTKKKLSTAIQLLLFLALGIGLIFWRYNAMDENERQAMFLAFKNMRWTWFVPIFIISTLSHYVRALRWALLLKPVHLHPRKVNIVLSVLIGYLANTLVPRLGEVAKCTVLAKYEAPTQANKIIGTVVAERAFDLFSFLLLVFLTLLLQYEIVANYAEILYNKMFINQYTGSFMWQRILIALMALMSLLVTSLWLYRIIRHSKIGKLIAGVMEGLKSILKVKNKGLFLFYSLAIWLLYALVSLFVFYAMPETEHISPLASLSVITFGSIAMMLTPGGVGAFPIIISQVLILYGITEGVGQAYGWINWGLQTIIVLILGLLALIILPIYNRNNTT